MSLDQRAAWQPVTAGWLILRAFLQEVRADYAVPLFLIALPMWLCSARVVGLARKLRHSGDQVNPPICAPWLRRITN
jgi:hypothetical protein